MPIRDILIIEYFAMGLIWLAVCVVYWVMTAGRWRRSPEGRLMMADAALFVWFSVLILSGIFLHDWPGRIWISVVSLGLISVTGLWRLRLIVQAQRRRRKAYAQHVSDAEALAREASSGELRGPHASSPQWHTKDG